MTAYTPCSSFTRFARIESGRSAVAAAASPVTVQMVGQEHTCAVGWSSTSRGRLAQALTPRGWQEPASIVTLPKVRGCE